jgi:hypothetical protein
MHDDGMHGYNAMDQRIIVARLNIDHYRRLLAVETDESKRRTIGCLLSEEEAKLAALEASPKERKA